ncbi:MAG: hypothetical protein WBW94_04490 [Anaerolineales bacterium]
MLQQIQTKTVTVANDATVMVTGYFYAVNLGADVRPQHHRVAINGECTCSLGQSCPAVKAVQEYLTEGGPRAARPPYGFYPIAPAKCPVCKSSVRFDLSLSSRARGAGWACATGGKSHYWQHRAYISIMRGRLAKKEIMA